MSALDLSYFLRNRANELCLNATEISKKSGISRQTWYRLINAEIRQARIETLVNLAGVLQSNLMELSSLYIEGSSLSQVPPYSDDTFELFSDDKLPTNAIVQPQASFRKTWNLANTGKQTWKNRTLVCVNHNFVMSEPADRLCRKYTHATHALTPVTDSIRIPLTRPGEIAQISVDFQASHTSGTLAALWKMVDQEKTHCFSADIDLICQVKVTSGAYNHASQLPKTA